MRILYVEFSALKPYIFRGLQFFCLANLRLNRCSCFGGFLRVLAYFGGAVQEKVFGGLGLCFCGFRFRKMIFRFQGLGDLGIGIDLGFELGDLGLVEVRGVFSVNGWNTFQVSLDKPRISILNGGRFNTPSNCQKGRPDTLSR